MIEKNCKMVKKLLDEIARLKSEIEILIRERIKWVVFEKDKDFERWCCSHCEYEVIGVEDGDGVELADKPNYCPNCGGKITYVIKT